MNSISRPAKLFAARTLYAAICCALAACGNQPVQTLADLPRAAEPTAQNGEAQSVNTPPAIEVQKLVQSYQTALESQTDPQTRQQIHLRLADLEMERLEQVQSDNPETVVDYSRAVHYYQSLSTERPQDDYILYRLARARALDGEMPAALKALEQIADSTPESPYIGEVLFRRGEAAFNRKDYRNAAQDFRELLKQEQSAFTDNARYMFAWSEFKSSNYRNSAEIFLQSLDILHERAQDEELSLGQQRLREDSLRGLALNFSYLGGAEAIESFNSEAEPRPYQHHLYRALGSWYREKELFRNSADTFLQFVKHYPRSQQAPQLHLLAVETLEVGRLHQAVLPAKREFVLRYGIHSDYWQSAEEPQQQALVETLRPWLHELAQFDHASAQALGQQEVKLSANKTTQRRKLAAQSLQAYLSAAALYQQYALTFPQDPRTPAIVFLMAECLEQAGDYPAAWRAYSQVAWEYQDPKHGAEAGYGAILTSAKVYAGMSSEEQEQKTLWLDRNIEASLKFANNWPRDSRALPVQLVAADKLLQQSRFPEAIAAAQQADNWQPPANPQQQLKIALVLAHSHFSLQQYPEAEVAYGRALNYQPGETLRRDAQRQLQLSVYRQAELALAQRDGEDSAPSEEALGHLLRIRDSGRTDVAATAQYDAINYLIQLGQWQRASREVADFRQFYAAHTLAPTLAAKAIVIFEALEMPAAAATELLQLASTDPDREVRRQSLFMAAENLQKAGEHSKAIESYRSYSKLWPEPAEQRLEAQYQLVQLYAQLKQTNKRNYWLQQLAQNSVKSPRGRYLAAYSQAELAEQSYEKFAGLSLRLPLKTSLANKKRAMQTTVADYRKILEFGIADFTPQANYRLAEVYRQLSQDLMDSQRPKNLNELELEQYEILLEEQAYPFEEKSIELHEANIKRTVEGIYDDWVKRSFHSLGQLLPARYKKTETTLEWSDALH
ncbi:tetratricopeptide repeat protein [Microbulbifer sp. OS29]|uniref:Tetratricopeptide repeat protein n=1 Tax=Microbulbifer okhotskensis TaxID=2926617 RepID=A0A9X2EIA9_9GAMM|nr:tetratricopeptide repeat protein [Microbulbifer okhotskensis]MCO1332764.1 tetratricopeptide repeat protein [Microbulbifer okhotskensis]